MKRFMYWAVPVYFIVQLLHLTYYVDSADYNAVCPVKKCNGQNTTNLMSLESCRCDSNCPMYGDCCVDAQFKTKSPNTNTFDCVKFPYRTAGFYVKRSCSRSYRLRCIASKNYDEQVQNVRLKLPVTLPSGLTYGNQYCASCNYDLKNFVRWNISIECNSIDQVMTLEKFNQKSSYSSATNQFYFDSTIQLWTYTNLNNKTENCTIRPLPPSILLSSLRKCYPNLVQTCPNSAPSAYQSMCTNYTSVMKDSNDSAYKNEYCALCNNVTSSNFVSCKKKTTYVPLPWRSRKTLSTSTISRGLSATSTKTTSKLSTTTTTTPPRRTTIAAPNINNVSIVTREFLHIHVKQNCKDLIDSMTLVKMIVETRSMQTITRTRLKRTVPISETPMRLCQEAETDESEEPNEESFALKFIVNLGVGASLVFTILHLYDFFFTTFTATLTQKSTASYAIALTIGNLGFLAGNITENLCHLLGAITYFGFLTSFFWLSAMAFDISCKVWSCAQEFDILGKNFTNTQKFTAYSLISWIFPPVATFIMTYVADRNDDFILVGRVYETCWFQSDQTLLLFFVFPLTITMSVNTAFYVISAYVVWIERSTILKLSTKYAIDFKFHTGLIVISNIMWSAALTATYHESSFFWICFAFLNAMLGLLVYASSPVKHEISNKISNFLEKFIFPPVQNDAQN